MKTFSILVNILALTSVCHFESGIVGELSPGILQRTIYQGKMVKLEAFFQHVQYRYAIIAREMPARSIKINNCEVYKIINKIIEKEQKRKHTYEIS